MTVQNQMILYYSKRQRVKCDPARFSKAGFRTVFVRAPLRQLLSPAAAFSLSLVSGHPELHCGVNKRRPLTFGDALRRCSGSSWDH